LCNRSAPPPLRSGRTIQILDLEYEVSAFITYTEHLRYINYASALPRLNKNTTDRSRSSE
jgi:hypothetical protein